MTLSQFIREHEAEIVAEWEAFARTQAPAAATMSDLALRDHARQILAAIATDIEVAQTPAEQYTKSRGLATASGRDSAASTHGSLRHESGFTVLQLTAEYRALRATVLRLWLPSAGEDAERTRNDILRFNEAIDQALAESVMTYSARVTRTRDMFLAILGHDLRAPLATMASAGELLKHSGLSEARRMELGRKVDRSARMMGSIVHDLLGFARVQLGAQMPIKPEPGNLRQVCEMAVDDSKSVYPNCFFQLETSGDLTGLFDSVRLHQLLTNLLLNAGQYRCADSAVVISAYEQNGMFTVSVQNQGSVIPPDALDAIFSPLTQLAIDVQSDTRPRTSLGLGLFVAHEIATAHGGAITVKSNEAEGTTFTVQLPRVTKASGGDS